MYILLTTDVTGKYCRITFFSFEIKIENVLNKKGEKFYFVVMFGGGMVWFVFVWDLFILWCIADTNTASHIIQIRLYI